jgi:hypothetical protein
MRRVRGNNYVISKFLTQTPKFKNKRLAFDLLYALVLYYVFFGAIIISDLFLVLNGFSLFGVSHPGPYRIAWVMTLFLFLSDTILAISYDNKDTFSKTGLLIFMYFTYR